jgi:tRNA (guanosine-2'-O-)-methyltransferase
MDRNTITELSELLGNVVTENKKKLIEVALQNRTRYLTVVLENIQKPHNASAVLRTVECLGLQDFYFIEQHREYEANPGIVKGAIKWVDVYRYGEKGVNNTTACLQHLKNKGYAIAVTSPHIGGYYPEQLPIDRPVALVFGNEQEGVSETALAGADYHLRIPMWGFTESYNLSVSAALCTYTIMQRIRQSENNWQLSEEEAGDLRLQWYRTLVKRATIIESEFWRNHDQRPD